MTHVSPLPDPQLAFEQQPPIMLLAQCILGEAEGESFEGKLAVGHVIMNRLDSRKWGDSIRKVVLAPWQFSCFNNGSPRIPVMRRPIPRVPPGLWDSSFRAAVEAFYSDPDKRIRANHYLNVKVVNKAAGKLPSWARSPNDPQTVDPAKLVVVLGNHHFLKA